ncbi:ubiquitin-conjugating enzyme E2 G1 [Nematocida minor]|uniref:ubiquitin-conjugating enzyme E2 G1 n=1 Tax=Nematocida minor TaxID=1912983 RepID=UPI00221E3E4D|nr:ubiquitin-conjugating enzyme E2 G1 [Nematocida minor]KAI5192773.1 ubiquitin-conjugating enzyme E2 G1 [Nematocida minor]
MMLGERSDPRRRSKIFITKELQRISKCPSDNYSVGLLDDNIYQWEILIIGPRDTLYENALLKGVMLFPETYPDDPPSFKFVSEVWHPNIDSDGNVCISILHKAGDDEFGYEDVSERWMPVRDINSILLSIILLLVEPNSESPANIEAAQEFINDRMQYNKRVERLAQKTIE